MISGALFFLALKLHRLGLSVDLTLIYHNISLTRTVQTPSESFWGAIYNLDDQKNLQKKMESIKISNGKPLIFFKTR